MKNRIVVLSLFILLLSIGCVTETTSNIPETTETLVSTTTPQRTSNPPDALGIEYQDISVREVMKKIDYNGDITILDVRTPGEFEEGHLEGAVHIPYQELEQRHTELNAPKDKEIIVYCKAGVRSKKGAQQLTELGYTNVLEMEAGIDGWTKAGGEIVKPTTTLVSTTTHAPTATPEPTTPAPTTTAPPTTTPQLQTTNNPFTFNTSSHTKNTYKQPKENC